ncbi:MAG: WecB/TagA/CpsF family glycosyltransferase [Myxococcaceae bacterium]
MPKRSVMGAEPAFIHVLGVRVAQMTRTQALQEVERLHTGKSHAAVAFVNAHTLNLAASSPSFRQLLNEFALVLNDGSGLALAGRLAGAPFPENLNGTDFTPRVLALCAERGWPVFFLGGRPRVAQEAASALTARFPGLRVVGVCDGYFTPEQSAGIAHSIRASGASVLLVAMGNPLQEEWLARWLPETGARVGFGVGALFDFAAGRVSRAPLWVRRFGVEWLYRLVLEPSRLWRRYVLGNPLFVARVLWSKWVR